MMMTKQQAEHAAALAHAIRPEWDERGLLVALHRARDLGRPGDIVIALLHLAQDERIRTPGMLPQPGPHWRGTQASPTRTGDRCPEHPTQPAGRCRDCDVLGVPAPIDWRAIRDAYTPPEKESTR